MAKKRSLRFLLKKVWQGEFLNMSKISGIIIARNEEEMIGPAIKSLSFCDEIIIVDTNSEDRTKQISEKLGAEVLNIDTNDFSEKRNFGLQKAKFDWALYIDADERVDEKLALSIKNVVLKDSEYPAYYLKRKNFYFGNHEWPKIEKLERLFKKEKLKGWRGKVHESPEVEGKIGEIDGFLLHFTHRDLESMVNKTSQWSSTEALLRFNAGHPKMAWWRFPRVMITAFFDSYALQRGFKAGIIGVIESTYQAYSSFITYAKLWELQKREEQKK